MCEEYNEDTDIKNYKTFELESMLRRILEIEEELDRTSLLLNFPPFEKWEIEEELKARIQS